MYHHQPFHDGVTVTDSAEEWIELYNRGTAPIDLSGWSLDGGVGFVFAAGTTLATGAYLVVASDAAAFTNAHPGVAVVGDLSGQLSNKGERLVLLDAAGNPADEVHYFDGGRWPGWADGGGSSLELRDPRADNGSAEAWAASREDTRAAGARTRTAPSPRPAASDPTTSGGNS